MSRIHFALSCTEGTTERKSTIGLAKEPDIGWACDYTDAKAKRLETALPLYYPNAHADTTARRSPRTCFESAFIRVRQSCYGFKPTCSPIPGTVKNRIGFRGINPASLCQLAISSNDHSPA